MRRTFRIVTALGLLTAVSACAQGKPRSADTAGRGGGGTPNDSASVRAEVTRLEQAWAEAIQRRDTAAAARLFADDFVGQGPQGRLDKAAAVAEVRPSARASVTSAANDDVRVRVLGPDAALAQGRYVEQGRDSAGKAYTERLAWLDVWQRRGGRWQLVAVQVTPIAP